MLPTVVLRRLLLITLLVLPQVYWLGITWRFGRKVRLIQRWLSRLIVIVAIAAMVAVLYDRIATKFLPSPISHRIAPLIQLWIFSSTFAFFLTKALHCLAWCIARLREQLRKPAQDAAHDASRRAILRQTASIVGGTPFVAALYGYAHERLNVAVESVDVPIADLPAALDGLRIVQLSDIHIGDFMPLHEIGRAVAIANNLNPHLAVITGDFVTSYGDPLAKCIHQLSRLRAQLGTWGCNGNHEIYAGAEDEAESLFAENGMCLLRHSAAQLEWNGSPLNLLGIDYQHSIPISGKTMPTLNGAENLVRRDMPNILLSHNPNTFPSAAAAGVELSLAGHTHGGQVNVEILHTALNPARFLTSFVSGLYSLPLNNGSAQQARLYVNRGLGTLGIPARIGSKPEITLLTLRTSSPVKLKS
jgi:uncharacterized protein